MTESIALSELREAIEARETIIRHMLVIRAIHDMLSHGLDAANEIEDMLLRAGYEQTRRGDWALFDALVP